LTNCLRIVICEEEWGRIKRCTWESGKCDCDKYEMYKKLFNLGNPSECDVTDTVIGRHNGVKTKRHQLPRLEKENQ